MLPTSATFRPTKRLITVDLPQLGIPAKAILIVGFEAPRASSFSVLAAAAFFTKETNFCILVLCKESSAKTYLLSPANSAAHAFVKTGSAKSALFKIIICGLLPTSPSIIGFLEACGIRASSTSTKTSISPNLSSS
ncbi:Uncharacterised protein [Chlamydia trachomatis]|nr:Uncharacterised protein [Chlamydia trachomatis]